MKEYPSVEEEVRLRLTSHDIQLSQASVESTEYCVYLYNSPCFLPCNITITTCMWHDIHFTVLSWKWVMDMHKHSGPDSYLLDLRWEAVRPASLSMLFSEMWLKVSAVQIIMGSLILECWTHTWLELGLADRLVWGLRHWKDYIKIWSSSLHVLSHKHNCAS